MQTTLIITGIIILVLVGLFLIARAKMKNIPLVDDHKNILTLTDKNFQHQTKNKLVLSRFLGKLVCAMQNDGSCSE